MTETVPINFKWPKDEDYTKLCQIAKSLGLSLQKYVIMSMKQKAQNLAKIENLEKKS